MGDRGPELKPEEQYPLLKADGGGDTSPKQTVLAPGWAVQCSKKNNCCSRWPELMSACWMTMILFGISFLVFYALGMGAYRRQQFVFVRCNSSKPANKVFYHHLVQRVEEVPFLRHSEYLSHMAEQYRNLNFYVFFLVDDSYTGRAGRQNRIISKLMPSYTFNYKIDDNSQQALIEFQKRFPNVNVTVMPLSKYMAGTPLRFKWRTIPTSFLPFYARAFSVWENGGVGMDLALHSVYDESLASRRKAAILSQHNEGINPEAYARALNKIDKEEDNAIFTLFFGLINRFLNETRSLINRTLTFAPMSVADSTPNVLIQAHRANRNVFNDSKNETINSPDALNASATKLEQSNHSNTFDFLPQSSLDFLNSSFSLDTNDSKVNASRSPQVVFFYDFHILSDTVGPSYAIPDAFIAPGSGSTGGKSRSARDTQRSPLSSLLSVDIEGTFVAASSRLHPFLGYMITAGCQRMSPKAAIQDAILSECSGPLRDDVYCNNIYIL